ncbi:transcription factor Sp3 [Chironomus tepperi]|uniref:transcription factor Sp3 n=1 Tax=Chironomus tepperi TaxID=113505 RepID=UPI00391FBFA6
MAGYRCVNFYDLCRLCSSVAGDKNVQIYSNETLLKKIKECLSISLNDKDKLPKIICPSCQEYVEVFSEFKKSCSNAQKMLESCLNTTKLRNGGQVYIKDEIPSKKVLKPIPNVNIKIATSPTTSSVKKNAITPNAPDFLSSIMQAVGIQTGEEITENCANSPAQNNFQQHQSAIQTLPQYTLTLDTLKPGQIQYKIENANNILGQSPIITAKNIQNQQVNLKQVDEFLKIKQKPGIIVKKEISTEDTKDKKAKFNLILKTTSQKPIQKIQSSQIISSTKAPLNAQNHKAQILNIEKILPIVNAASPTKQQVVVPVMIRTNSNEGRIGETANTLLAQAITGNHGTENKPSIQQPFYMQMKLQSNADGQLTFTPAAATPQQIQLSLSPQQLQQLSFQTTQSQTPIQTQISTAQDIHTQTIVQELPEKIENEEEVFSDTFDNDYYQGEEENDSHESQEKELNVDKKTLSKKVVKTIKPVKLKTKIDTVSSEVSIVNPQHSDMAKKQLNLLTTYNNNNNSSSKRIENETIDKSGDINLTVCDVCKKVFKRKEFLMQHLKSHIGLRPFKCEESQCNKSFSRKEHLLRHISSHTGKKEFTCNICNKLFSRKDNLNKHKRIHPDTEQQSSRQKQSQIAKIEPKCDFTEDRKNFKVKKFKLREDEPKAETIENVGTHNIPNQTSHQPKIVQIQQMGMKNENSQQIILSVSQAQAMLSQSKAVYTLPSNFILNQHTSFITPNNDLVGNMKFEPQ